MPSSRRAFAKRLAAASLVKPLSSFAGQEKAVEAPGGGKEGASKDRAKCFDQHELETVSVLAELIIPKTDTPGAREAEVPQYLDTLLAVGPEGKRDAFLEGLWWLDGYCLRSFRQPFKELPAEHQIKLLTRLLETSEDDLKPGHTFVVDMKHWTGRIYYATQAGEQELNKGGQVPSTYTGECHL